MIKHVTTKTFGAAARNTTTGTEGIQQERNELSHAAFTFPSYQTLIQWLT